VRTPVELRIPIPDAAKAGDRVQVYTDFGSGTVDMTAPLLADPAPLFPSGSRRVQTAKDFPAKGAAKSGRPAARLSETASTISDFKQGSKAFRKVIEVRVFVPPGYGTFRFYAQLVDAAGNVQGGTLPLIEVFLSGVNPPPVRSFALASYDSGADQLTFNVERNEE